MRWNGDELHLKLHCAPVTAIKLAQDKSIIFSSGYDGAVKGVTIGQHGLDLYPRIFCGNSMPIVAMEFMETGAEETLGLLTLSGHIMYIDRNMHELLKTKLPLNNTMAGLVNSANFYAISEGGVIVDANEEVIGKLGSRGWSSLTPNGPR